MDARTGCDDIRFRDRGDYLRHATTANEAIRAHRERSYARAFTHDGGIPGFCVTCGDLARFAIAPSADGAAPNWRESLHCARCGLFSRVRFSLDILARRRPLRGMRIYLTEQTTPAYVWLKQAGADVYGSEFVTDPTRRAALDAYVALITDGADRALNVEDVTQLSFADGSHDAVVSFDVLEHVPDYRAALREFRRVLAPGGTLVLTVPFDTNRDATLVRAQIDANGAVEHRVEPEYHGDPTTNEGCLAFYTFGWDLLDEVRAAGFEDVRLASGWAPARGYLGSQLTLLAAAGDPR